MKNTTLAILSLLALSPTMASANDFAVHVNHWFAKAKPSDMPDRRSSEASQIAVTWQNVTLGSPVPDTLSWFGGISYTEQLFNGVLIPLGSPPWSEVDLRRFALQLGANYALQENHILSGYLTKEIALGDSVDSYASPLNATSFEETNSMNEPLSLGFRWRWQLTESISLGADVARSISGSDLNSEALFLAVQHGSVELQFGYRQEQREFRSSGINARYANAKFSGATVGISYYF